MIVIHPQNPQQRLIDQAAAVVQGGGIIVYPTDSAYALGCAIDNRDGVERIRRIRQLDKEHNFTLVCRDLSELSAYARFDNVVFRLLKAHTPGPYTFVLQATKEVPKRLQHPKRKTIGLRIPDHPVAHALLETLDTPMLSVSLIMPGASLPISEADDLEQVFIKQVDEVIDGGHCGIEATTVVDLTSKAPHLIRVGKGDVSVFE
jgi:tRNA threonylcarbamoyl adenosine modification protein (Sua5/YciO/YrdC/YwlC family)